MRIIKAKFEVVTPMFLGESPLDKETTLCANEIRGASVKGALRAHFRALNWSRIRNASASNDSALKALHKEEADIFGSAVKEGKGGQASFLLRVKSGEIKVGKDLPNNSPEVQYLLGMGIYNFKLGMLRDHIPAGTLFELELVVKPSLSNTQIAQIKDTLLAFGLLGGLGSRARKGFGSVSILSLSDNGENVSIPSTLSEYKDAVKSLVGSGLTDELPPLTAFSKHTKLQVSAVEKDAMGLLKKHGYEMGRYRGYGRNDRGTHKVFGEQALQLFKDDHDWVYDFDKRKETPSFVPKRTVFGLPHPYFTSSGIKLSFEPKNGRRASPLFAHVHKLGDGGYALVHTVFHSEFLPNSVSVIAKSRNNKRDYSNMNEKVDWTVLDEYLQRFNPKAEDVIYG